MNFGNTPHQIENERKRILIYTFVIFGSIFLSTFAVTSFLAERYQLGFILSFFFVIALIAAKATKKARHVQPIAIGLSSLLLLLSIYLLLGGGAEGTGAYWTYSVSIFMVLMVGPHIGSIFMALYMVANFMLLFGDFEFIYPYTDVESKRIVISSFSLGGLILMSEWVRVHSYGAISKASEDHRQLANTDPLTGLQNRLGTKSLIEAKETCNAAIVALLDIDHFKTVNDAHGHDAGDIVLKKLANLLKKHTKGGDITARWGGEEFLLVLYDTNLCSAERLVQKINHEFAQYRFTFNHQEQTASFSAGLATMEDSKQFESAVSIADKCLYKAKNNGRNKVVSTL